MCSRSRVFLVLYKSTLKGYTKNLVYLKKSKDNECNLILQDRGKLCIHTHKNNEVSFGSYSKSYKELPLSQNSESTVSKETSIEPRHQRWETLTPSRALSHAFELVLLVYNGITHLKYTIF